jgi:hypothetical protein
LFLVQDGERVGADALTQFRQLGVEPGNFPVLQETDRQKQKFFSSKIGRRFMRIFLSHFDVNFRL